MFKRPVVIVICLLLSVTSAQAEEHATGIENVLVFGASGRIGQHIVDEALLRGYTVTGVSRSADRLADYADRINIETGDILDRARTAELIAAHDAVIVSVGGPPQSQVPEEYIAALAAESLIEVLEGFGADGPRMIFVGNLFTLIYEDGQTPLELGRVDDTHRNYAMFYGHQIALDRFRDSANVNWTVASPPNGLRLEGRTGEVQWGGDELLRDADGVPLQISPEDYAFAIFEELEAGNYVRQRFNVGR
ncbi:MAG: NAD(P)H-binding protein [Pseudomonadota bacterium]